MKKKKEDEPIKAREGEKTRQPQILLPSEGELWVPNKHFPGSALKSLDFRRAMSFMSG